MGLFSKRARARRTDWDAGFVGDELLGRSEAYLIFQAPNMSEPIGSRTMFMVGRQKIAFFLADLPDAPINTLNILRSDIATMDYDELKGELSITTTKGGRYQVAGIESVEAIRSPLGI